MIYLQIKKDISNINGLCAIDYIHYMPFDLENGLKMTHNELLESGYLVNELPDCPEGDSIYQLMYNPVSNTVEYVNMGEIPPTSNNEPDTIESLKKKQDQMQENFDKSIAELSIALATQQIN